MYVDRDRDKEMLIGNELLIGRTLESDCLIDCAAGQATVIVEDGGSRFFGRF